MEGQVIVDAGSWAQWASAGGAIIAVVFSVVSNVRSARKSELRDLWQEAQKLHDRISALRDDHTDHGHRLARAETMLEHLPTREMVANLATKLEEVSGDVRVGNAHYEGLRGRIDGIGLAVDQLVENELREKRHEPR